MVRKRADDGTYYHHPPYTWAEEMAIYKGMDIDGPLQSFTAPVP